MTMLLKVDLKKKIMKKLKILLNMKKNKKICKVDSCFYFSIKIMNKV